MNYNEDSIKGFFVEIPRRIDGIAMIISIAVLLAISLAPNLFSQLADFIGTRISAAATWLAPLTFIVYASLAYFSAHGVVSRLLNAAILLSIPILLFVIN